jgi:hypothetical protein
MGDIRNDTLRRQAKLVSLGYKLVVIDECDFDRACRDDMVMRQFCDSVDIREPMDARETLYGGRVDAQWTRKECKRGEKINYLDVVSGKKIFVKNQ